MYRTLTRTPSGNYVGRCPECNEVTLINGDDLEVAARCEHFVRRWRVAADKRVRVEYRVPQTAGA
jgi:hypothetical protein